MTSKSRYTHTPTFATTRGGGYLDLEAEAEQPVPHEQPPCSVDVGVGPVRREKAPLQLGAVPPAPRRNAAGAPAHLHITSDQYNEA